VTVGAVQDEGRAAAGFAAGIVLYMALTFAGSMVANAVAMEKSTRISEVLLAVVRPSQVLMGTVLSVGATTLAQILILATPVVVASRVTDGGVALPAASGVDLALAVSWFLLGFVLYAVAFAAAAALVDKITEVSAAITPVTVVLVLSYLGGIVIATRDTEDALSVLISMFPFSAPVAMPIRWASGEVPGYQLVLAMALTAATALLMVRIASSFYRKALLITGHRVRLSEILRRSGRERADDVGPRGAV
jgi:ABC-2 type transport system permease protein